MSPHEIATKADIEALSSQLLALLQQAIPAVAATDDFLSVQDVATLTNTSAKTVRSWIKQGKPDQKGRLIRLFALEFSPGIPRIPRSALVAYGQGLGFDVSQLQPSQLPQMRVAA